MSDDDQINTQTRHVTIDNGGVALHVAIDGPDDAPPVLVLHGITSGTGTWDWLVPLLTPAHRVLRLDFRGHGGSARAPGEYHSEGYVSDAVAVVEQVAGRPVAVIGHSLGGVTAAGLGQSRPDLVTGMVLEDPPLVSVGRLEGNSLGDSFRLLRESVPRMQEAGIDVATLTAILTAAPTADGSTFGESLHTDAIEAMATALLQLDASVLDVVVSGGPMSWVFDADQPLTVPTYIAAADPTKPDAVCRAEAFEKVCSVSGDHVRAEVIDGTGHLIHDSRASRDRFATAALAHLATLG